MSLLKILTYPDPILHQIAKPVSEFDRSLKKLSEDMLETMYDSPGVGLAANQVGVLKRIITIDVDYTILGDEEGSPKDRIYKNKKPMVFVNPEIIKAEGKIQFKEGCLSVPGFTEEVKRFESVEIRYQNIDGKAFETSAKGLLAVCIQHEIDHLNGRLFIDRLSVIKKSLIKNKLKKERGAFERSKFHVEL